MNNQKEYWDFVKKQTEWNGEYYPIDDKKALFPIYNNAAEGDIAGWIVLWIPEKPSIEETDKNLY